MRGLQLLQGPAKAWSQGYLNQGEKMHSLHLLQAGKHKNLIVIHGILLPVPLHGPLSLSHKLYQEVIPSKRLSAI